MESKLKKRLLYLLLSVIGLTMLFILTNSLRPPEESMEQSDSALGFIGMLFSPEKPFGAFLQEYGRKIAHFIEYGLLGAEVAILVNFYLQKRKMMAVLSVPLAMCFAVIDETLQYFSGRGPAILDVWIDLGGFLTLSLITYGVIFALTKIKYRLRHRAEQTEITDG